MAACRLMFDHLSRYCGLPRWRSGKESACQCRRLKRQGFDPWSRKIPWKRKWQPTPVFLPGKSHGQRSLGLQSMGSQRIRYELATEQQHCETLAKQNEGDCCYTVAKLCPTLCDPMDYVAHQGPLSKYQLLCLLLR